MASKATGKAIIRFNKEACGIELVIPDGRKLSLDEQAILKSLGFAWHRKNKYYYTRYTEEKMGVIRESFLGKDAQFPAKTEEKVLKEIAIQKAKEAPVSKPKKISAQAQQIEALNSKFDKLIELMMATQATASAKK